MNIAIQTGNLPMLKEALASESQKMRFGSEFCMYALPSTSALETAYTSTREADKDFVYISPRLANGYMDKIREHLSLLDDLGGTTVVVNDLGTLSIMREFPSLTPYLGRQLVYTPSRCPWKEITEHPVSYFTKRKIKKIFYQTSLNYEPTLEFFKERGVVGADVDWIPEIFNNLKSLTQRNLQVSVHLYSVPVAITRKCHMARFLGEEDLDQCSRPCYTKAYSMDNELLGVEMYLHGNAVFKLNDPDRRTVNQLARLGVRELVLTMSPLSRVTSHIELDGLLQSLQTA
jgi:collagenase-like PrtC family protease